jgi:hypothetical protein
MNRQLSPPKPKKRSQQPPERSINPIVIQECEYDIPWELLSEGHSFFIPTLATVHEVREALTYAMKAFKLTLHIQHRTEYSRRGVRVWCMKRAS